LNLKSFQPIADSGQADRFLLPDFLIGVKLSEEGIQALRS
jgi:hypothetical protein